MNREVIRTNSFANEAADFVLANARHALAQRGEFRIALSGGNTPRPIYGELAKRNVPWKNVIASFGDERCVPPDDAESNYRMAQEALFQPANVPASSILRMRGEIDPQRGADEYQAELDARAAQRGEKIYEHDLILLGLGEDGHTASLFPATAALKETQRRVAANYVAKLDSWRLTFTFGLIFAARHVCFLVDANKRAELIERVFSGDESLPSAIVDKNARFVTWILGKPA